MTNTQISVVIPAYNYARFLPKAIESALGQTLPPQEIIVVDDGSADDTREVVARYPVHYIFQENQGLSGARNTGIRNACGEWIALLDADDWWHPQKLEMQSHLIANADVIYTALWSVHPDGQMETETHVSAADLWPSLIYYNSIGPSSVLVRKQTLMKLGLFDTTLRTCEELDLWFRMIGQVRFASVSEPLTYYRMHPGSITADPQRMLDALKLVFNRHLPRHWIIRRSRAFARQYHHAAVGFRQQGKHRLSLENSIKSLLRWPSPFWMPRRFRVPLITIWQVLTRRQQFVPQTSSVSAPPVRQRVCVSANREVTRHDCVQHQESGASGRNVRF